MRQAGRYMADYRALRQRYTGLQMLYDFTKVVSESLQAQSVLEAILDEARSLLHAEIAQIVLRENAAKLYGTSVASR